jgi:serine O-acetyltransferase
VNVPQKSMSDSTPSGTVRASLREPALCGLIARQLNHFFPDDEPVPVEAIHSILPSSMARLTHCFSHIRNKYFFDGERVVFNHLHGDQYAMLLYWLSFDAHRQGLGEAIAAKLFLLNKSLHGLDAFYEVELPSVFLFVHPLGTVLGRGHYQDHLLVYQRCSVGSNHDVYPTLGRHVTLHPGSSVLGRCVVGAGCSLATHALLLDKDLEAGSLYMGNPASHRIKPQNQTAAIWRS